MTTIKRFTPDYKMHAVRFEAFAREAEHGELVRFDAHQQVVSALKAERDAQQKRADALAVENAALKSGCGFFAYDPDNGFEEFKTKDEAIAAAESYIDYYRGEACDGWPDEVAQVSWGIIIQESTRVNERPRTEDDGCDPAIETVCDYALLPKIEPPATDAALAAIEARSITAALDSCSEYLDTDCVMDRIGISYADAELRSSGAMELCNALKSHAKQLREAK
ncbi:hypothetical protein SAMN02744783_00486 [Serratia sp. CC22-02]|uniref:hypothetical protein n=1 Tax=Serratia sp. CC22-02 TaxID=1378076 RepID=UPI00240392BB|nr:hypothetical protein [Serratia sp. CC22-02]SMP41346.1 hypothetical protein SAMN02744783_00486 [Serratia sp. CC22-02]